MIHLKYLFLSIGVRHLNNILNQFPLILHKVLLYNFLSLLRPLLIAINHEYKTAA